MQVKPSARFQSDETLIADVARVAASDGTLVLTRARYDRVGSYHSSTIVRRLGSWAIACSRAGISSGREDLGQSDDAWMENILGVWESLGRQPSYGDMRIQKSKFSPEGYAYRFGSWTEALLIFQRWLNESEPYASRLSPTVTSQRQPKSRGRTPSLRLRWEVMNRDRFSCRSCGVSPALTPGTVLHIDHIVPFSDGGETEFDNLQVLCDRCNYGKSNRNSAPG